MDILTVNDRLGEYPKSFYAATATPPGPFPSAKGEMHADVCVIGGGYTGLSCALHLARKGFKTVLLEASRVGFGASGRNGGQVGTGQRLEQTDLENVVSMEQARLLWRIGLDAVQLVRELCSLGNDDCEFTPGIIHANHRERFTQDARRHVEHMRKFYDYDKLTFLDKNAIRTEIGSDDYVSGVLDMGGGHIHPLKYAFVLARMAATNGVALFENSRVTRISTENGNVIETAEAKVHAKFVVQATNGYHNNLDDAQAAKVMPINNFIAVTEPLDPELAHSLIQNDYAVADSRFVINYFRLSRDKRMVFGGGESYGYRFPTNLRRKVSKPMLSVFPKLKDVKIQYAWGGTLGITMSRLPRFYRDASGHYSMSGFSGHGIAMGTMAGKLAADAIAGDAEKFDVFGNLPAQNFPGTKNMRTPLLALAMIYYSLRDRL